MFEKIFGNKRRFESPSSPVVPPFGYDGPHPAIGKIKEYQWRMDHGDETMMAEDIFRTLIRAVSELEEV